MWYFTGAVLMFQSFQSLYNGNDKSMTTATTPHNKPKNRFAKIYPCKYTMISLGMVVLVSLLHSIIFYR